MNTASLDMFFPTIHMFFSEIYMFFWWFICFFRRSICFFFSEIHMFFRWSICFFCNPYVFSTIHMFYLQYSYVFSKFLCNLMQWILQWSHVAEETTHCLHHFPMHIPPCHKCQDCAWQWGEDLLIAPQYIGQIIWFLYCWKAVNYSYMFV